MNKWFIQNIVSDSLLLILCPTLLFSFSIAGLYYTVIHDDVIKWKHIPRYWPFVWGIHRSPVNSPRKGQWRGALMFSLICAWIKGWANNREASDLRRDRTHCDVIVMYNGILLLIAQLSFSCYFSPNIDSFMTTPWWFVFLIFNPVKPRQNYRHFVDGIFD